jgi:hypothetical protein
MSRWGLKHKGVEVVMPSEWNSVVDALQELDGRAPSEINGGIASFTGDGENITFDIAHGLSETPDVVLVGKGAGLLPDIEYWTADDVHIHVTFKVAPASGASVKIWWLALLLPPI